MEGSTQAPIRHPIPWRDEDFWDQLSLDKELRRVFDICHGCRRCFNLCDSFPQLFDVIDESESGELDTVSSDTFPKIAESCTLCDMCFLTKCPYVPPHEFNIDFPHLMLRYRTYQDKQKKLPKFPKELAKIDRNAATARLAPSIANWSSGKKNKLTRKPLELLSGIDQQAELPKFEKKTFHDQFNDVENLINKNAPAYGRKVAIYSTCYVNHNNSKVGIAANKVLNHNGVETISTYPGCCGMPHLEQAQHEKVKTQSEKVSKELCNLIDKGYDIITLTASCGLMLKFSLLYTSPSPRD